MKTIRLPTIDSTNTYAKTHSAEFAPDQITCITAEEQTGGRGRFGRKWVSPKGVNLYVTFYFRLPARTASLTCLAQVMAVTAVEVLMAEGISPKLKWPNDILLNRKKLSGVLCETSFLEDEIEVILGIGINVNMEAGVLESVGQPATSLKHETGRVWDREMLLGKLQEKFSQNLQKFLQEGFASFHAVFEQFLAFKGEEIRVFDGQREWVGICESLSPDGKLNLRLPDHSVRQVTSGDVSLS